MRKRLIALFLICLSFLAACSNQIKIGEQFDGEVNAFDGVTMTVIEGTAYPGSVSIEVYNTTDQEIDSGNAADFGLQVEQDGKWYWLKENGSLPNTADALVYTKDVPVKLELTWANRYGSLPKGHYRIVKGFFEYRQTGDNTDFLLAAEFTLE